MAAADNSSIDITIKVIDANSGAVVNTVTKNVNELGAAGAASGQKLRAGLNVAGEAGTQAGAKIGAGMREAGQHSLNALDNVRLVRDDLGIRIPRAMEKVISQSKLAMGAIGAIGGGLVALGGIEVLFNLGEQAYKFYQRITDVNAEMRKFSENLGKSSNEELFSNSSIETTVSLLKQVNDQIGMLEKQRSEAGVSVNNKGSFMQYVKKAGQLLSSREGMTADEARQAEQETAGQKPWTGKNDAVLANLYSAKEVETRRLDLLKIQKQVNEKEDALQHAGGGIEGRNATNAKLAAKKDLDTAQYDAQRAKEQYLVAATTRARQQEDAEGKLSDDQKTKIYQVAGDSGLSERQRADRNAELDARDTNSKQGRTEMNEARHATAEAGMSGEEGEKLFLDQKLEAQRQLKERAGQVGMAGDAYSAMSKAIDTKFLNEQRKRIGDENAQTAQIVAEAGTSGLTGLARIDADRAEKIAALDRERKKFADPSTYGQRLSGINQGANAESTKQQESFNERMAQLDAARADRYESESEKITSAAARSAAEVTKAWREGYGQLGPLDQRRVSSYQALQNEIVKINADAARQRVLAGQHVEDETQRMEREASRVGLPKGQEQTQAIYDELAERLQKIHELREQAGLDDAAMQARYDRQEVAARQIANGKLVDEQRAMRDKLAGVLEGMWSNPLEALKRQGEQMASKAAAGYILKLAHPDPGTMGTGGKQGGNLFGLPESWMDVGGFNHRQRGAGVPGMSPRPGGTFSDHPTGGSTISAATATIHVQSATITGLGGGGGMRNAVYQSGGFGGGGAAGFGGGFSEGVGGSSTGVPSYTSSSTNATAGAGTPTYGNEGGPRNEAIRGYQDSQRMPGGVASTISGGVSQLGGMGKSADQLGKELGVRGSVTSKIPGMGKLGQLGDPSTKLGGAAAGAMGLFSSFEGGGGLGGALQGGLAGAQLGAQVGGPIGAAIGAAGGAIIGFIGFGARQKAAKYDRETVKPQLASELRAFEAGSSDYQTVYNDFDKLQLDAKLETRKMGSGAKGYYNDTIKPEIDAAQKRLTREQQAGRSQFGMTAAQFHTGGLISGFGDLGTSGTEGFIHAMMGERVINPVASSSHAPALDAINSGATHTDMASYYGAGAGTAPVASSPADVNLHFHSPDAKGARDLLMNNKHHVRAALNSSFEDNSGGFDFA